MHFHLFETRIDGKRGGGVKKYRYMHVCMVIKVTYQCRKQLGSCSMQRLIHLLNLMCVWGIPAHGMAMRGWVDRWGGAKAFSPSPRPLTFWTFSPSSLLWTTHTNFFLPPNFSPLPPSYPVCPLMAWQENFWYAARDPPPPLCTPDIYYIWQTVWKGCSFCEIHIQDH